MHALGDGKGLLAALDGAGSGHDCQPWSSNCRRGSGKADHGVVFLHIAANQLVGLRNANDFLDPGHLLQRALLDLAFVAGDADGGALRAGHGVCAIAEAFDFLADAAYLFFGGLRLHDD
jgi:hypothetical protein